MVKFITDSSCDLVDYPGIEFVSVPLHISTNERTYVDDKSLDTHEMLTYLASYNGRSYTACPSIGAWLNAFEGGDEIYVTVLTSGLSGAYNSALSAKEQYISEHPDAKICIVDTLTTGPEMRILFEKIVELKQAGRTLEEIDEYMKSYRLNTHVYFSFQSLHNFAQNGRVNKVVASAVGMLHINIIGMASPEGTVEPIGKCRSEKKAIDELMKEMKKAGYHGGTIRICHIENEAHATNMLNAIKAEYPNVDAMIYPARGICTYYGEKGGIIIGCDCN